MFTFSVLSIVFFILVGQCVVTDCYLHPLSDEFIAAINFKQSLWKAGRNFHRNTSISYIKKLAGTVVNTAHHLPARNHSLRYTGIPKRYDVRSKWRKNCPTVTVIRDQGPCSSCWASAAAAAMSDRMCIMSQARDHFYYSEDDLLTCCKQCWIFNSGCDGGLTDQAWLYFRDTGIVSGGSYNSNQGCRPYELPPCEHNVTGKREECGSYVNTPKCSQKCNDYYNKDYYDDRHKGTDAYKLDYIKCIMKDIHRLGPVTAIFNVYEDFLHYKSGIYQHIMGKSLGYHTVKLLGWGSNNNVRYWLAANSWNTDWGDGGFFKILRGSDHCEIERHVMAGIPTI